MASIDDLTRLVPPPIRPADPVGDWFAVEAALGLALPSDFKTLLRVYGSGEFLDVCLLVPWDTHADGAIDLVKQARRLLMDHESFRDEAPDEFPYPLYPEPGGLLEWGGTGNGDRLCWLTTGDPDEWPVVVWNLCYYADRYDVRVVGFLHGYLSGDMPVQNWAPPPAVPWFEPHRERMHVYLKLSEGDRPYEERLRLLRDALAPTVDRGAWTGDRGARQDHFKAVARDWQLTYETAYGHQIRVAFPPDDEPEARTVMYDAVRAMGCRVESAMTIQGEPVWSSDGAG
jgi:hypothetical protein